MNNCCSKQVEQARVEMQSEMLTQSQKPGDAPLQLNRNEIAVYLWTIHKISISDVRNMHQLSRSWEEKPDSQMEKGFDLFSTKSSVLGG